MHSEPSWQSPEELAGIATAVCTVLTDPATAARRARAAKARLAQEFDWTGIAAATAEVYHSATVREHPVLGRPKIATGNAFRD